MAATALARQEEPRRMYGAQPCMVPSSSTADTQTTYKADNAGVPLTPPACSPHIPLVTCSCWCFVLNNNKARLCLHTLLLPCYSRLPCPQSSQLVFLPPWLLLISKMHIISLLRLKFSVTSSYPQEYVQIPCGLLGLPHVAPQSPQPPTPALHDDEFYCSHTGFLLVPRRLCILFSTDHRAFAHAFVYPECPFITSYPS